MPHQRPGAEEVALARAPGDGGVEAEAGDGEVEAELGILLEEVGDLVAGKVGHDHVGLAVADLGQDGGEIRKIGRHQLVGGELSAVLLHEPLGDPQSADGSSAAPALDFAKENLNVAKQYVDYFTGGDADSAD